MNQNFKEKRGIHSEFSQSKKQKNQFRSYYCAGCKQVKPCQLLTGWDIEWKTRSSLRNFTKSYCCACYYQNEQQKAQEYSSYEKLLFSKQKEQLAKNKQYQLLKNYPGCQQCGSQEVDTYSLYQASQLVCQPCLIKKEGGSSSPISFLEQQKWYRKFWKIELAEWLENYQCLPVNKNCAERWLKDRNHLNNCHCLEQEAQENYLLFANSLKEKREKLEKECKCEISNKPRTPYYDSANYGYAYCENCEARIKGAGKTGVIKNRNDPRFWGLEVREKVLCLECLGNLVEKMEDNKRYVFNKYRKRGYI